MGGGVIPRLQTWTDANRSNEPVDLPASQFHADTGAKIAKNCPLGD